MLRLRLTAPFAVCRPLSTGYLRPTLPFLSPASVYGLMLAVAGIDTRLDDGKAPMTLTREDLPNLDIALGEVHRPQIQSVYQQLHNYPVGDSPELKARAEDCKGNKYNIQPVRRQFLSGIDAVLCLRGDKGLLDRMRMGLRGEINEIETARGAAKRYGLLFLGDNSFLPDRLEEDTAATGANWYCRVAKDEAETLGDGGGDYCRLSVWIDRKDMSRTVSALYRRHAEKQPAPPEAAWTTVGPGATN